MCFLAILICTKGPIVDVFEGHVYISHDVVFDENIYPFAHLHPNVGARLKSEFLLLPPSLLFLNPSSHSRDDNSSGSFGNGSLSTNLCHERAGSAENMDQIDATLPPNDHDFMLPGSFPFLARTSTDSNVDPPANLPVPASSDPALSFVLLFPVSGSNTSSPRSPPVPSGRTSV